MTQASVLLAKNASDSRALFGDDEQEAKRRWRRLAQAWHPDHCDDPQAGHVFDHLRKLYTAYAERRKGASARTRTLEGGPGAPDHRVRYLREVACPSGPMYVGRRVAVQVFEGAHADLCARAASQIGGLPHHDDAMREAMRCHLPGAARAVEIRDGAALVLDKEAGAVPALDLAATLGGLAPEHAAWVMSSLAHIGCYLESAQIAHQAIEPAHLLIDPVGHSVTLAGGWEFATKAGARWHALPQGTLRIASEIEKQAGRGSTHLDRRLARECVRTLLGARWSDAPQPMRDHIDLPPESDAVNDYARWERAREAGFGRRRYVDIGVGAEDIYAMAA